MVFPFPVFFLFAKRGLQCFENGFVEWLDDICQMGGGAQPPLHPKTSFFADPAVLLPSTSNKMHF